MYVFMIFFHLQFVVTKNIKTWNVKVIANEPSERRRSNGEAAANRAAQEWAIGRKILDRAEKSVT